MTCGITDNSVVYTIWKESLALLKFGKIDNWPKICQIFTIQIFTHLESLMWILNKLIGRYFLGMCPTTCSSWGTINHLLIAMGCGSCEFPVSRSQSKSPSAKGLSHIQEIGSHGSLEPLNLYKTCKLSFQTFIAHN